jgi:FkbM family methyltransferase
MTEFGDTDQPSLDRRLAKLTEFQRHFLTERATSLLFRKVVQAGDTVLDVGANNGEHTRTLAALVGPSGTVHAFEPNAFFTSSLEAIGKNVTVWQIALYNTTGDGTLYIPIGLEGWASLNDRRTLFKGREFNVRQIKTYALDELPGFSPVQIKMVKIDSEETEEAVLAGMSKVLQTHRPIIVFENPNRKIAERLKVLSYSIIDFWGRPSLDTSVFCNGIGLPDELSDQIPHLALGIDGCCELLLQLAEHYTIVSNES